MNYVFVVISVLSNQTAYLIEKFALSNKNINPIYALKIGFGTIAGLVGLFILITQPQLPDWSSTGALLLSTIIAISAVSNIADETSLKINDISFREPFIDFIPIMTGFMGYIIFPDERHVLLLAALILGCIIIGWGVRPKALAQAQKLGIILLVSVVILEGLLNNIYALTLEYISPEYITLVRSSGVFILLILFLRFRKGIIKHSIDKKAKSALLISNLFWFTYIIASLYAIESLGVITTMLLLLLTPLLRYASAFVFLKDKPTKREIISSILLSLIGLSPVFLV